MMPNAGLGAMPLLVDEKLAASCPDADGDGRKALSALEIAF